MMRQGDVEAVGVSQMTQFFIFFNFIQTHGNTTGEVEEMYMNVAVQAGK